MTQVTKEVLKEILDKKLKEKLKPICESMGELKDSIKFLSDKYDSVDKRVGELEGKCQSVIQENKFLRAEVLRLSKSFNEVSSEIDNMNQYGRRECVEISGLPVQASENTNDLVIKIGSLIGVKLNNSDISISHRLPSSNLYSSRVSEGVMHRNNPASEFPKVIVKSVKFVRRETKELFYKNRKTLKQITTKDLGLSRISDNKIYVSESLSSRNKELFKDCLKFKHSNNFKYIWTQQGRIYMRKNNDTLTRIIACKEDLDKFTSSR